MPHQGSLPVRVARVVAWPVRRFFNPKFDWVRAEIHEADQRLNRKIDEAVADAVRHLDARVDEIGGRVSEVVDGMGNSVADATQSGSEALAQAGQELRSTSDWLASVQEQLTGLGGELGALRGEIAEVRLTGDWLASLQAELDRLTVGNEEFAQLRDLIRQSPMRRAVGLDVTDIDAGLAELLNYSDSHLGFRAQAGLWFNPPVQVAYHPGGVSPTGVNERIVEIPFAFRALGGLPAGARVLDVGSAESVISLSLASLGYEVTSIDLREYPLHHPSLHAVASPLEDWDGAPEEGFDAVVCVSTIEHFGVGAYGEEAGDERADIAGVRRLRELTRPGGRLVLTAPYAPTGRREEGQRVYDRAGVEELLEGWEVEELVLAHPGSEGEWRVVPEGGDVPEGRTGVVMVVARAATE